jgi:glutamine amidotransferase
MCRFLAYRGQPAFLEDLVASPCHSLVHQSLHAAEAKAVTNGDGFGLGWYGEREEPGLYREIRPAWSDENLLSIARQVRSHLFFAHVRAATGTATSRANCHPFSFGPWMFMHNGQIGGWSRIRRRIETAIPDHLYGARAGTTDSEALFLRIVALIEAGTEPVAATATALAEAAGFMREAGIEEPLRFAAALTDGRRLFAFRFATDDRPPTLYACARPEALIVASEPVDGQRDCWKPLANGEALRVEADGTSRVVPITAAGRLAA